MAPKDTEVQVGLTAPENTKRGYGLWRDEVIHPADPRMDEILASGDPITDTKGLGLRYTPVRGGRRVEHFRANTEQLSAALDGVFPDVHNAVVRLVAEDIRDRGLAALKDWCVSSALPEPFEVWEVRTEMRCDGYRPDICVRHPEGGQIELEVVNTHAPEAGRLDKAWNAGHIVLSLRIRDVVEEIVFSAGRGVVPKDDELRALLKGRRFTLCGRSEVSEEVRAVWRDLGFISYAKDLVRGIDRAWAEYERLVHDPLSAVINSVSLSEFSRDERVNGAEHLASRIHGLEYPVPGRLSYTVSLNQNNIFECVLFCADSLRSSAVERHLPTQLRDAIGRGYRLSKHFPEDLQHQSPRVAGAIATLRRRARRAHRRYVKSINVLRWSLGNHFAAYLVDMPTGVLDDLTRNTEAALAQGRSTRLRKAAKAFFDFPYEHRNTQRVLWLLHDADFLGRADWAECLKDLADWNEDTRDKLEAYR